ncbi:hypothetical protein BJP34_00335 [Moorena producens PAL-8-15-08-1]|uniref:CopG family transcriptional regulator n=1 Tax=Moorena producens PAL-8-15-08-1 TaxID=1458985 RepID=A0A1D8TKF0_9CYAN|nr:hypothetical protein BJP34_00335 [Moorena producens PAL-8-15-08-1]NEO96918.1 hypothetical protein [Moorena sp. SIO3G5]
MTTPKPQKSQKRMRGVPVHYDQLKKVHGVMLTDYAWNKLRRMAQKNGVSAGEFIERLIRGIEES